jgi:Holliday junction resolvasome RuvABC endonuclease subunit
MSRILAVDLGYRNLGVAVVDTDMRAVHHSVNWSVGHRSHPHSFVKNLWARLDDLEQRYGPFDGFANEMLPQFKNGSVAGPIGVVLGILSTWCYQRNIPTKEVQAMVVKRRVADFLGMKTNDIGKKKSPVGEVVRLLTGSKRRTNHEDDAVIIGLIAWGDVEWKKGLVD